MGTDDDRKRAGTGRAAKHHVVFGRRSQGFHECRKLAASSDVDHDRSTKRGTSGVDFGRHQQELAIGVADVQQEVDEILVIDISEEVSIGEAIRWNRVDGWRSDHR